MTKQLKLIFVNAMTNDFQGHFEQQNQRHNKFFLLRFMRVKNK